LIEAPRTKRSRRSPAQPSTSSNPRHPRTRSRRPSQAQRPPGRPRQTPEEGSTFDRRSGVSLHPAPTARGLAGSVLCWACGRAPLRHERRGSACRRRELRT
jgi:hypothetical protein